MATDILTPQENLKYRLAEEDRQAILSQRPPTQAEIQIERERRNFIQKFGGDGTENTCSTWYSLP